MSSQVPVWFWRRISRLVADQESRGGAGDSGAGETESVMRMNLAEGCRAVNRAARRVKRETCETSATWTDGIFRVSLVPQVSRVSLG
jgi:hypothetical protein